MQRDIKLGLIVGAVLLVLCAVFYLRSGVKEQEPLDVSVEQSDTLSLFEPAAESEKPKTLEETLPAQTQIADVEVEEKAETPEPAKEAEQVEEETVTAVIEGTETEKSTDETSGVETSVEVEKILPVPPAKTEETLETPEAKPAAEPTIYSAGETYVVQNGDTLAGIAKRLFGSSRQWRALYEANRDILRSPDMLAVGMELKIPAIEPEKKVEPEPAPAEEKEPALEGKTTHVVAKGETLWSISEYYFGDGSQCKKIAAANPKLDPNRLRVGQVIVIPEE